MADVTLVSTAALSSPGTGTLSATFGAITLTATGVLPIVGTLTNTLASIGLSAAGVGDQLDMDLALPIFSRGVTATSTARIGTSGANGGPRRIGARQLDTAAAG